MGSEPKANVVQSFTRAGSWGGSGGRDPPQRGVVPQAQPPSVSAAVRT
jgi:hypothetical protein